MDIQVLTRREQQPKIPLQRSLTRFPELRMAAPPPLFIDLSQCSDGDDNDDCVPLFKPSQIKKEHKSESGGSSSSLPRHPELGLWRTQLRAAPPAPGQFDGPTHGPPNKRKRGFEEMNTPVGTDRFPEEKSSCESCNCSFHVSPFSRSSSKGKGLLCFSCGDKMARGLKHVQPSGAEASLRPSSGIICSKHRDPNCPEEACVYDFFDEYSPFDDTEELQAVLRRSGPTTKHATRPSVAVTQKVKVVAAHEQKRRKDEEQCISLVSRSNVGWQPRPYLSLQARRFLALMGKWEGFFGYDGCLLHVDFTALEAETLWTSLLSRVSLNVPGDSVLLKELGKLVPENLNSISHLPKIPGRTNDACIAFLKDCRDGFLSLRNPTAIKLDLKAVEDFPPSRQILRMNRELGRGGEEIGRVIELRFEDLLQPWRVFTDGSSDIVDISWSESSERFGLACTTYNDEYNRPGNLMLGSVETSYIKMLKGHTQRRENQGATLDPEIHSTVSSVKFSSDGELLYSGSYDRTVKVWRSEDGVMVDTLRMGGEVDVVASSLIHGRAVAAGSKDGMVKIFRLDDEGHSIGDVEFGSSKNKLYPSTLVWGNYVKPNWLLAGYDTTDNGTNGDLVVFDAMTGKLVTKVTPGSTRQFDLYMHPESDSFVTGSVARTAGAKSHVRLYTLSNKNGKVASQGIECDSPQVDINKVTISYCERYLTSSATDGSTLCWDTRFPNRILAELRHGPTKQPSRADSQAEDDTGVTFAQWGPTNDRFYTGSSDGVIKVWDIKRGGDPWIQDLANVETQIMSAAFSPDWDMLMVGECTGRATLFSTKGDRGCSPSKFDVDIGDVVGWEDNELVEGSDDTVAADAARELVRSGKMVIRDGVAYATGR